MSTTTASSPSRTSSTASPTSVERDSAWLYDPSLAAAAIFLVLYSITTVLHIFQMIRYKKWMCWPLVVAGLWETFGYLLRIVGKYNRTSIGIFATMLCLIVLAPAWVAAFDYMVLGRLLNMVLPDKSVVKLPARKITLVFVLCDVISFMIQSTGSGILSSSTDGDQNSIGGWILITGLGIQIAAFGFFTVCIVAFQLKTKRGVTASSNEHPVNMWPRLVYCLYISCFCILLRSIFRIAEFSEGWEGALNSHEVYFYCLEAVPMLPPFYLFNIYHPGKILVGEGASLRKAKKTMDDEIDLSDNNASVIRHGNV